MPGPGTGGGRGVGGSAGMTAATWGFGRRMRMTGGGSRGHGGYLLLDERAREPVGRASPRKSPRQPFPHLRTGGGGGIRPVGRAGEHRDGPDRGKWRSRKSGRRFFGPPRTPPMAGWDFSSRAPFSTAAGTMAASVTPWWWCRAKPGDHRGREARLLPHARGADRLPHRGEDRRQPVPRPARAHPPRRRAWGDDPTLQVGTSGSQKMRTFRCQLTIGAAA